MMTVQGILLIVLLGGFSLVTLWIIYKIVRLGKR